MHGFYILVHFFFSLSLNLALFLVVASKLTYSVVPAVLLARRCLRCCPYQLRPLVFRLCFWNAGGT